MRESKPKLHSPSKPKLNKTKYQVEQNEIGPAGDIAGHTLNLSLCVNWNLQELAKPSSWTTKGWAGRSWQPNRVEKSDWEERGQAFASF